MVFNPGIIAAFKINHIFEETLFQYPTGCFATSTATTIESNRTLRVKCCSKFLVSIPYIDVHTTGNMTCCILLGSTHINKLHIGIGYVISKLSH